MRRFVTLCVPLLALALTPPLQAQSPVIAGARPATPAGAGATPMTQEAPKAPLKRLITLQLVDAPLAQALEEIARSAGLNLGYPAELVPAGARVTLDVQGRPAEEVLATALRGTGLELRTTRSGHATLLRRPRGPAPQPAAGTVTGRVTSAETGAALVGASVRVEGTGLGTLTDARGGYTIERVPAGSIQILASSLGFAAERRNVTMESGASVTAHFQLSVSAVMLDQVVVTGTATPTLIRALPTPISVITAAEIQQRNISRIDDLFRGMIPGAQSPSPGATDHASRIYIRGASTLGNPSVKTYVDGIEMTDHSFIATIDPAIVERIEIVRGPQAASLYGPEALSGVLQIFTKRGVTGERPTVRGKLSFGGIQSEHVSGPVLQQAHSISIDGGGSEYTYRVGGSYEAVGGWLPSYSGRMPSLHGGATAHHGSLRIDLSSRYAQKSYRAPDNPTFRAAGYAPWMGETTLQNDLRQTAYGLQITHTGSRVLHTVNLGHDGLEFEYYLPGPRRRTPADTFLTLTSQHGERRTARVSTTFRLGDESFGTSLSVGADQYLRKMAAVSQSGATRLTGALDGTSVHSRITGSNTGLFTQANLSLRQRIHLTAGLRADRNRDFGSDLGMVMSPRIGAAVNGELGSIQAKLRSSYGEAIRPPLAGRNLGSTAPTAVFLPNLLLAPERQRGWDAGFELHAPNGAKLSVTRYDQRAVDLIEGVLVDATVQPRIFQFQNIGIIANSGWEVEAGGNLGPVRLTTNYSLTSSRIDELSHSYSGTQLVGDQLIGVSRHSGSLDLTFALSARTRISSIASYRSSWKEMDWLAYYAWIYGGVPYRGAIRDYLMDYQPTAEVKLMLSRDFSQSVSGFLAIDNLTNNVQPRRDNATVPMGRSFNMGFHVQM